MVVHESAAKDGHDTWTANRRCIYRTQGGAPLEFKVAFDFTCIRKYIPSLTLPFIPLNIVPSTRSGDTTWVSSPTAQGNFLTRVGGGASDFLLIDFDVLKCGHYLQSAALSVLADGGGVSLDLFPTAMASSAMVPVCGTPDLEGTLWTVIGNLLQPTATCNVTYTTFNATAVRSGDTTPTPVPCSIDRNDANRNDESVCTTWLTLEASAADDVAADMPVVLVADFSEAVTFTSITPAQNDFKTHFGRIKRRLDAFGFWPITQGAALGDALSDTKVAYAVPL
jgi:hypothetical protein